MYKLYSLLFEFQRKVKLVSLVMWKGIGQLIYILCCSFTLSSQMQFSLLMYVDLTLFQWLNLISEHSCVHLAFFNLF